MDLHRDIVVGADMEWQEANDDDLLPMIHIDFQSLTNVAQHIFWKSSYSISSVNNPLLFVSSNFCATPRYDLFQNVNDG